MAKMNGKLLTTDQIERADELAALMIKVRNKLKALEQEFKEKSAPWVENQRLLEGKAQEFLKATGQESAKTRFGTIHLVTNYYASLEDPDAFMDYVMANGAFELMDRRANSTACREFAEENGKLPPGVHINAVRQARVREAS